MDMWGSIARGDNGAFPAFHSVAVGGRYVRVWWMVSCDVKLGASEDAYKAASHVIYTSVLAM